MDLKIFIIFTLFTVVLTFEKLSRDDEEKVVESYFRKYPNVRGGRSSRHKKARENILKHFYEVQDHNERFRNGTELYQMELNEFSAQSDDELARGRLGFEEPLMSAAVAENDTNLAFRALNTNLPDYWNWAEQGIVQPVQDQGNCGSCYAFAAIGVIESSMCRFYNNCVKLSEQEAMECTNGCNGGWDTSVYSYASSSGGCTSASNYAYLGFVRNRCNTNSLPRVPNSESYNFQILPNDAETIMQFLYDNGPLFVAFDVYNNLFSYRSGIVTTTPGNRAGGHAVLLVGYGTSNGTPYWILKNSWGSRWGENGYFRVIRGVNFARIESWKVSFAWTR